MSATTTTSQSGPTRLLHRARRLARSVRHAPDRLLHGYRRRRAQRLQGAPPRSVLFVCHGNICRSPYAAAALAHVAGGSGGVRVSSAGFIGPGRPAPPEARAVASERGIDLSEHRSQLITPALLAEHDVIVVMSREQGRDLARQYGRAADVLVLGDLDPHPIDTRTILDPYSRSQEVFVEVFDRIDRCLLDLWRIWQGEARGQDQGQDQGQGQGLGQ